ncbi:MAG: lipid-binding domain protein [Bacteroidetes bacterium]|nr:lipid-binding domain protein [Bacteroidota bacterium]
MIPKYKISLFLLLAAFLSAFSQSDNSWHLKKSEGGILVYTRNSPGSDFKELKSVCTLKTSLSSIVALLNDWDTYPQWVYKCGKSTTLKKISESELVHYQTVVAPWPVDSRDFVVNVRLSQDPVSKVVKIVSTCKPDYIPKVAGYVRITEFSASWTLVPQKDGTVEVIYQLLVNPGGYVPAWLVNLAVVDGPYETTLNFKQWVMKEKYQKAVVPLIKN